MTETSFPSSGGEHLVSHSLDMMSSMDSSDHDLHGRQVGVGVILTCELYRRVLAVESPALSEPVEQIDRAFWGPLTDVVDEEYQQKVPRLHEARRLLAQPGAWDGLRQDLAPLTRAPELVRDCLRSAGAAWRAEDIGCSRERLEQAFRHARQMRSRFTVLDLAHLAGVLPGAYGEIVEQWG
jgi:glycerol-1-phosphate dehydrogenase [NAD(P)+]